MREGQFNASGAVRRSTSLLTALVALAALASAALGSTSCSSGSSTSPGGSSADVDGGITGTGDGDSNGEGGATSPLSGTWDVIVATAKRETNATLELSPTTFALLANGDELVRADLSKAVPEITATVDRVNGTIRATHREGAMNVGQLPLPIGGTWDFQSSVRGRCGAAAEPDYLRLDCTNIGGTVGKELMDYDLVDHRMLGSGVTTAQRTSIKSSIFGDLGGVWSVGLPRGGCDVTFEGSNVDVDCFQSISVSHRAKAKMSFTFSDGTISGSDTVSGVEITAKRR